MHVHIKCRKIWNEDKNKDSFFSKGIPFSNMVFFTHKQARNKASHRSSVKEEQKYASKPVTTKQNPTRKNTDVATTFQRSNERTKMDYPFWSLHDNSKCPTPDEQLQSNNAETAANQILKILESKGYNPHNGGELYMVDSDEDIRDRYRPSLSIVCEEQDETRQDESAKEHDEEAKKTEQKEQKEGERCQIPGNVEQKPSIKCSREELRNAPAMADSTQDGLSNQIDNDDESQDLTLLSEWFKPRPKNKTFFMRKATGKRKKNKLKNYNDMCDISALSVQTDIKSNVDGKKGKSQIASKIRRDAPGLSFELQSVDHEISKLEGLESDSYSEMPSSLDYTSIDSMGDETESEQVDAPGLRMETASGYLSENSDEGVSQQNSTKGTSISTHVSKSSKVFASIPFHATKFKVAVNTKRDGTEAKEKGQRNVPESIEKVIDVDAFEEFNLTKVPAQSPKVDSKVMTTRKDSVFKNTRNVDCFSCENNQSQHRLLQSVAAKETFDEDDVVVGDIKSRKTVYARIATVLGKRIGRLKLIRVENSKTSIWSFLHVFRESLACAMKNKKKTVPRLVPSTRNESVIQTDVNSIEIKSETTLVGNAFEHFNEDEEGIELIAGLTHEGKKAIVMSTARCHPYLEDTRIYSG